jgi:predicted DNA-binding transcriptional regulator AlpA
MSEPNEVKQRRSTLNRPPVERLLFRLDDVAQALGIARRTLERERSAGRFAPADLTIGRSPLWKPETVREWIDAGGGLA